MRVAGVFWLRRRVLTSEQYASNSVAVLVIGNESYLPKSKLKSLAPWVSEDVELVVTFFRSRPGRNTILPPVPDCEQGQILAAMRAFVEKAKACDACVVYYTGHGLEGVLVEIGGSHVSRDDVISVLANVRCVSRCTRGR